MQAFKSALNPVRIHRFAVLARSDRKMAAHYKSKPGQFGYLSEPEARSLALMHLRRARRFERGVREAADLLILDGAARAGGAS